MGHTREVSQRYLDIKTLAIELGYHPSTIYRAVQKGKLKATCLTEKGKMFIDRKDLEAHFARNKSK